MAQQSTKEYDTPSIPASEAVVLLKASVHINTPAALVFRSLRNTETWKDWNWFCPKVTITYQPPEDDVATAAEIAELVRNTSIIGSFDSDLTDGGAPGTRKPRSPEEHPPPRFRLGSMASQMSGTSDYGHPRMSESADGPAATNGSLSPPLAPTSPGRKESVASATGSTRSNQSAAQKYQAAQAARHASIALGEDPGPVQNTLSDAAPVFKNTLTPPTSPDPRRKSWTGRRKSAVDPEVAAQKAREQRQINLLRMYGEPSVRIQLSTKMIFHSRMREDQPRNFTDTHLVVTEVSRPDDPITESELTALTRTKTHTLSRSGVYRIVWASDHDGASLLKLGDIFSGAKLPKSLLHAERVTEIKPTLDGAGNETCTLRTWEAQKGHAAKIVKKKYEAYLQRMFERQGEGLKDFCEGLYAPKVERRDFSIS